MLVFTNQSRIKNIQQKKNKTERTTISIHITELNDLMRFAFIYGLKPVAFGFIKSKPLRERNAFDDSVLQSCGCMRLGLVFVGQLHHTKDSFGNTSVINLRFLQISLKNLVNVTTFTRIIKLCDG